MIILLDIDNCIADDAWRIPRIDWRDPDPFRRYMAYHTLAPFDRAANFALHIGLEAVVLTSRPVMFRAMTLHWLQELGSVKVKHLLMRNNDDHRPSLDVKRAQAHALFTHYDLKPADIFRAYDDRPEIVEMYRTEFQLDARVKAIHDVCAYTNPATQEQRV